MSTAILSVTELNRQARLILERNLPLLWVSGEISNLTRAASGHVYFSLKDSEAQVRCAMFRSRAQLLPWKLENGQQVEVQALVTLYEARGDYQLNVESVRRAGIGRLYEMYIRLRDKLAGEGLFAPEMKRPLPRFPRRIGIVTSPQAAALRDVAAALRRRAPHVELILYPTLVQGTDAPAAILQAIEAAGRRKECDLLLVVRGGGSLEDLWAFNDEAVARTLAASPIPTISGIGHETDTTIADHVADQRAATPTAAAELASAGWFEAEAVFASLESDLQSSMRVALETRMQTLDRLALQLVHPAQRLAAERQRLELMTRRLISAGERRLAAQRPALDNLRLRLSRRHPDTTSAQHQLERLSLRLTQGMHTRNAERHDNLARHAGALAALSPLATLERGYSIVRDGAGNILRSPEGVEAGSLLDIRFAHGTAVARLESSPDKS